MPDHQPAHPGDNTSAPRRSVTLNDVAKAAGVSVATASFVASDRRDVRVSQATRERVQRVIDDLGYRPNILAQTLKDGRSRFIGLVADAIATTPFAGQIIHGAQDEAWKHGYVLLIANTEGNVDAEREAIRMMLEHRVHGVLYSTWFHRAADLPAELGDADVVMVNCFSPAGEVRGVVPDERQGGRSATEALLANGHTRVAFINATTPAPAQTGRLQGYHDALAAAGIPFDPDLLLYAFPDQEGGYQAAAEVIRDRRHGGVLLQRPDGHGPLRPASRTWPHHPRGHGGRRLRQPGSDRSPPTAPALDRRPAALRARCGRRQGAPQHRGARPRRHDHRRLPTRTAGIDRLPSLQLSRSHHGHGEPPGAALRAANRLGE